MSEVRPFSLAFSSSEVMKALRKAYPERLTLHGCPITSKFTYVMSADVKDGAMFIYVNDITVVEE